MLPLLRLLPAEMAHQLTLRLLPYASYFYGNFSDYRLHRGAGKMAQELFGATFVHPFGMAAGFDKNAEVPHAIMRLGFAFLEVGTITPEPQFGNKPPRLFRLNRERAIINRLGFPSHGMDVVAENLDNANNNEWQKYKKHMLARKNISKVSEEKMQQLEQQWETMEKDLEKDRAWLWPCPLLINIGPNKLSPDPVRDFAMVAEKLHPVATAFVINVSSPNTAGLRALQNVKSLKKIVDSVRAVSDKPLLFKFSPDISRQQIEDMAQFCLGQKINGAILTNSTVARFGVERSRYRDQTGGLSGKPLFNLSTRVLAQFYLASEKKIPLIGVGGVMSPQDVITKIKAGARLVESYTGFVYRGRALLSNTIKILDHETQEKSLASMVGADAEYHANS